jgi:hypothetical protein
MIHQTPSGKRIEHLISEVLRLDNAIADLANQHCTETIKPSHIQKEFEDARRDALEEAEHLIAHNRTRLDEVSVFKIKKPVSKKKVREYWYTAWGVGKKSRNIYLGSCQNMDVQAALQKARRLKAEALGLHCPLQVTGIDLLDISANVL